MMGQLGSEQYKLFYSLNLDIHVPRPHLLRSLEAAVEAAPVPTAEVGSTMPVHPKTGFDH